MGKSIGFSGEEGVFQPLSWSQHVVGATDPPFTHEMPLLTCRYLNHFSAVTAIVDIVSG